MNLNNLLGLTEDKARDKAKNAGFTNVRVFNSEKGNVSGTMDRVLTRLNLYVENGVVVKAVLG